MSLSVFGWLQKHGHQYIKFNLLFGFTSVEIAWDALTKASKSRGITVVKLLRNKINLFSQFEKE